MPTYKLTYFNVRGRGELCRYVFHAAGKEFEDERITDWPAYKPKTPFGQLPVLTVDGKQLAQSKTIAKFLAREFGLNGKTSWDDALIDQCLDLVDDFFAEMIKYVFEKDEEKKKTLQEKFEEEVVPKYLNIFEKGLTANGGKYYVGDALTLADLTLYCAFDNVVMKNASAMEKFPKLSAHREMVAALPKLAQYISDRKPTDI